MDIQRPSTTVMLILSLNFFSSLNRFITVCIALARNKIGYIVCRPGCTTIIWLLTSIVKTYSIVQFSIEGDNFTAGHLHCCVNFSHFYENYTNSVTKLKCFRVIQIYHLQILFKYRLMKLCILGLGFNMEQVYILIFSPVIMKFKFQMQCFNTNIDFYVISMLVFNFTIVGQNID